MTSRRGFVAGLAVVAVGAACSPAVAGRATDRSAASASTSSTTTAAHSDSAASSKPALVWSPNRVPTPVVRAALALSPAAVVVVANGTVWLPTGHQAPAGYAVPVDVTAAPPHRYGAAVPAAPAVLRRLSPGQVVLSADSAKLRGLHVGSRLRLGALRERVVGIVADSVIGDAEFFVTGTDGARLQLPGRRYVLIRPADAADWPRFARRIRAAVPSSTPVQILAPGRARALRQAASVLSPLEEKLDFGEFSARPQVPSSGYMTIAPGWRRAHLLTARVPMLGYVTCNRAFLGPLRNALQDVVRQGLASLVHRGDYGGCYAPRLIPDRVGQSISHHAFGSAIDINVSANPLGARPHQDPRLVRIFAAHRLTWGGLWLVPDGMHFEGRW
jgi:hypothetical protein